jgi:hypothetical protein
VKNTLNKLKRKNQEYKTDFSEFRNSRDVIERTEIDRGCRLTKVKPLN